MSADGDPKQPSWRIHIDAKQIRGREGSVGDEIVAQMERFEEEVQKWHPRLDQSSLETLDRYVSLLTVLKFSLLGELEGFTLKCGDPRVRRVLDLAVSGMLRSLRASRLVMDKGFYSEAHALMRLCTDWMLASLAVEADKKLAFLVEKLGLRDGKVKSHALSAIFSNPELKALHDKVMKTFGHLSERAHVTKTAIALSTFSNASGVQHTSVGGIASEENWLKDTKALAALASNCTLVMTRHFSTVAGDWARVLNETRERA